VWAADIRKLANASAKRAAVVAVSSSSIARSSLSVSTVNLYFTAVNTNNDLIVIFFILFCGASG